MVEELLKIAAFGVICESDQKYGGYSSYVLVGGKQFHVPALQLEGLNLGE